MKTLAMSKLNRWPGIERYAPWLVLAAALGVTYLLWQQSHRAAIRELQVEFDTRVADIGERIHRRVADYEQVLHAVRAFQLNQREMERHEFGGFVAALELARHFPGVQGVSYAPMVTASGKAAHVAAQRRSGLPDYAIGPPGERAAYAPVSYIEPMDVRNQRVLGFDNLSDPARRLSIEQARDENRAIVSERLVLKQENEQNPQAGFLMFLPVFRPGAELHTVAERRAHIVGWFAASFRMDDLIAGIFGKSGSGINVEIFDSLAPSEQARMYGVPPAGKPRFTAVRPLEIGGHRWTVRYSSRAEFEAGRNQTDERKLVAAGILLSLLMSLTVWLLLRDWRRAMQVAQAVGRELEMRIQAEHESLELHRFNRAILEKSPAGIAVFRGDGACVMANEAYARLLGGTVEQVLQQDFRHNASWQRNGLLAHAEQALASGLTLRRDIEGVTSFGRRVMAECIFSPVTVGGRLHLLLIASDVSERVLAERALKESMRELEGKELAKSRFLAAAGHDLRQPIAAANLFVDALKLTGTTAAQDEIIQRLDQSMATFNGLLNALLDVSKLEAGMVKPEFAPVRVAELFSWLEQNFAPMAQEKHLAFRLHFPFGADLQVNSDIGLLKSALMNLVSNAIKFTRQGGVLVSARRRSGSVLFQVWDTGIGIEPHHAGHVFDEFYQVDNPQRERSGGLGLGLAIARRALTLLGGSIVCNSKYGRGSVFAFSLPALDRAGELQLNKEAAVATGRTVNDSFALGKRFVVLEDDALVGQAMSNWLQAMGAEVRCFRSAEEALQHRDIEQADYFIADYMLAGPLNGIQFLNQVRQKLGRPIHAVLVTGDTSAAFIRHAVECDWTVLHKPINTARLIAALGVEARASRQ